ncbi:MAG: hypothetical protein EG824_09090 [Deltaproteobacteria bacterium]|nr:hypothetical protein [Deltaproteobacteria bacterium]
MKKAALMRLRAVLFTSLVLALFLQLAGCSGDTNNTLVVSPGDDRADRFVAALKTIGYGVSEGSAHLIDPANFVNYHVIDSAAGNNAGQPYKRLQVLPFPNMTEEQNEKAMGVFRLQPYEAVVYVGPTPPKGDYFSFTPFLWTRLAGKTIPKGDWIFAALGDPLNNSQIKVEGGGTDTFEKKTIVIFTADQGVNDRIVAKAKAAGYPESMINTYVIPSKLLDMGVDTNNDSFLILVRTANVYDQAALFDYNNNDHYARIFRVTPDFVPNPLKPFDTPPMANRKAHKTENELVATYNGKTLADSLDDLKQAIIDSTPALQVKSFESVRWFAESRDILTNNNPSSPDYHKFVAGEASDTPYLRTSSNGVPANFTLGPDDMVVVYGVNHEATGLSTYSNFSVYSERVLDPTSITDYFFGFNNPVWCGITGMGSKDSSDPLYGYNRFANSAYNYLPLTNKHAKYLYAVRVLRQPPVDPDKKPWITVPEPTPEGGPASGILLADPLNIGYRAYVNPATTHGPDYGDIIPDRALWFKLK